jgi:hypothetical protein
MDCCGWKSNLSDDDLSNFDLAQTAYYDALKSLMQTYFEEDPDKGREESSVKGNADIEVDIDRGEEENGHDSDSGSGSGDVDGENLTGADAKLELEEDEEHGEQCNSSTVSSAWISTGSTAPPDIMNSIYLFQCTHLH